MWLPGPASAPGNDDVYMRSLGVKKIQGHSGFQYGRRSHRSKMPVKSGKGRGKAPNDAECSKHCSIPQSEVS